MLDITEFFGETTGGVRTYLLEKARYVQRRPELRQVLVVPGAEDEILEASGVRCYRLHGPHIPTQKPYRFMLATRSTSADRGPRAAGPDRGRQCLVRAVAGASRDARAASARGLVLPQQLSPHHRPAALTARAGHVAPPAALAWRYVRRLGRLVQATLAPIRAVVRELERAGVGTSCTCRSAWTWIGSIPTRRARAEETRRRFGLPEGPLAMYVGRIAAEKEIDLLLERVARGGATHRRSPGPGGGGAGAPLAAPDQGREARHWLPYQRDRDQLADLYAAMDLYVAPCSAETFGLSALEALASGLPVLSADRGGVPRPSASRGQGASTPPATPGTSPAAPSISSIRIFPPSVARVGAMPRSTTAGTRCSGGSSTSTDGC